MQNRELYRECILCLKNFKMSQEGMIRRINLHLEIIQQYNSYRLSHFQYNLHKDLYKKCNWQNLRMFQGDMRLYKCCCKDTFQKCNQYKCKYYWSMMHKDQCKDCMFNLSYFKKSQMGIRRDMYFYLENTENRVWFLEK